MASPGAFFQARTIQYMPDTADAPGIVLPGSATASELTSLVGAPLIAQDEVIGVLCLSIPSLVRGAKLVPDQQTLLSIFANQAAMAIANARLHQKMVQQAWESHMLAEASQRLSASLDCEWVAATIVEQARLIVGTPLALILVRDQFEHFRLAACAHAHPLSCETLALEASHTIIPAVERALGSSAATPAILETAALPPALVEAGCSGLLALPLRLQERLLGVLLIGLGSDVQPRSSGAPYQNLDLLLSLADRATLALENARLYQEQVGLLAELKALQSHLVRSETLAATGRLAASLAHEINNPLAIIRASLGMARTRLEREHPAWSELADIDEELDRISRITRSLLDFARSPAPCSDLTDLNQAIETLVRVILPRLSRQQIALSWEPEPGSPVLAIPSDSLKQIVLNLVTNAIDAMPDGGLLTIKTQSSGTFATIAVSDTGIGIPAEDLGRIFDPFFTTKRDGGTGLGLAILDRLVRTYDGRIEVESSPGHGSTFRIRLPLASIREGMGDDATGA
ncbi:MAG: hypothetical protein KatS3mg057_0710 [Herpetosiphonaceae bacterium]|nr:MAG: hypothetical protein KatS3mg057_0710 [Herpetosiphonaceae bacterium]